MVIEDAAANAVHDRRVAAKAAVCPSNAVDYLEELPSLSPRSRRLAPISRKVSHPLSPWKVAEVEEKLLDETVVVVSPYLRRCSVNAKLAGSEVKLKCRGSVGTFKKSDPHRVPDGGGELCLCEPRFDVLFEGDQMLDFELCDASKYCLKRNKTLAKGSLALATVFKLAGFEGTSATLTVELVSTDNQIMGWVEMDICPKLRRLRHRSLGLDALKVHSLPRKPGTGYLDSFRAPDIAKQTREYTRSCVLSGYNLRQARSSAFESAGLKRKARGTEQEET